MAQKNQAMTDLLRYNVALASGKRSRFNKSHSHTTTFDSGYIIPLMWDRVLPGDEKQIKYNGLARMATPLHPVMDQAIFDVWCFYVPDRLWYGHAKEFYGENKDADFNPDGLYVMPYLKPSQYAVDNKKDRDIGIGSLNDYFGFPVGDRSQTGFRYSDDDLNLRVSAGLHRSYQLIWNEWFRNSSIQPALQLSDADVVTDEEWIVIQKLRKANKYPDYFTSLLREPQAGPDVTIPLGNWAPVVTRSEMNYNSEKVPITSMRLVNSNGIEPVEAGSLAVNSQGYIYSDSYFDLAENGPYTPANLWANLSDATSATINSLRTAFTVQQFLEIQNRSGKRYQQIIYGFFGVLTGDSTLQRPQLLGSCSQDVGMRQVIQTSASNDDSPLGNTAAFSITNINNEYICNQSFTEGGFLLVLGCVRPVVSYSQGLDPLITKLQPYEHYWPVFDNIGNQPVYTRNLYLSHEFSDANDVFGYAEAWTEYRIKQNRVSGLMRPDVTGTLSSWNYSLYFDGTPYLDSKFIEVDPKLIDRTISTPDEPQFICDSYFEYYDTKPMSVHSIPGLKTL